VDVDDRNIFVGYSFFKEFKMEKIDKLNIEEFIFKLEKDTVQKNMLKKNLINKHSISTKAYLNIVIQEAKDLIFYGEYKIAIENILNNLLDEDIIPTKDALLILTGIQDNNIKNLIKIFCEKLSYQTFDTTKSEIIDFNE
jgi:hypothetical protein